MAKELSEPFYTACRHVQIQYVDGKVERFHHVQAMFLDYSHLVMIANGSQYRIKLSRAISVHFWEDPF